MVGGMRVLKDFFSSQGGFSMIGALAAGGLMGGLALVLAELTKQQTVTQKKIETRVEVSALHQQIQRTLQDRDACQNTVMGGTVIVATSPPPPAPPTLPTIAPGMEITIPALKSKANRVLVATGNTYGNRLVSVTSQTLRVSPNAIAGGETPGTLEVVMNRESRVYTGQKTVVRRIPLILRVDGSNNLTSCQYDESALVNSILKKICEDVAKWPPPTPSPPPSTPTPSPPSPWDPTTRTCNLGTCSTGQLARGFDSTGRVCQLPISDLTCATGEAVVSIDANGVPTCRSIGASSCLILSDAQIRSTLGDFTGDYTTSSADNTCGLQTLDAIQQCTTNYTPQTPLGCCYRGGVITPATGGNECALTDGSGRALTARYCQSGGNVTCPSSPPPANRTNCNQASCQNLIRRAVGGNTMYWAWFCDPPVGSVWRNCLVPSYRPSANGVDCQLVLRIVDIDTNDTGRQGPGLQDGDEYSPVTTPWNPRPIDRCR